MRQKDDIKHWFIAGFTSGLFSAVWSKKPGTILFVSSIFAAAAGAKKEAVDNGYTFFKDFRTSSYSIIPARHDWTLTKERPKDYITVGPEKEEGEGEEQEGGRGGGGGAGDEAAAAVDAGEATETDECQCPVCNEAMENIAEAECECEEEEEQKKTEEKEAKLGEGEVVEEPKEESISGKSEETKEI